MCTGACGSGFQPRLSADNHTPSSNQDTAHSSLLSTLGSVWDITKTIIPTNSPRSISGTTSNFSGLYDTPIQLYGHFRFIQEVRDCANEMQIEITEYSSLSHLIDKLRELGILHYLVPSEIEDQFNRISRMQLTSKNGSGNISRTVKLVGYWLHECWANHSECSHPSLSRTSWPKLPSRVVDLSDYQPPPFTSDSKVKVIQTNSSKGAYIALSYRWPQQKENKTLKLSGLTLKEFSLGISACDLLSQIQDACTLAKGLGIRYLWVDALCIIQGEGGDWNVEAENMASIYMNATVTIAVLNETALSAAGEEKPFVSNQEELSGTYLPFKKSSPESIYLWLSKTENFVSRPLGDLDERAWVFQEQLLSRRMIYLTQQGVFWDCLHHSASCNRPTGILGDFSTNFQHSDNRKFRKFLLSPNAVAPLEEYYWLWKRAVQSYTKRKLTNNSDRFIALEGVTRQMTIFLNDVCIFGIWKKNAPRLLIWFVEPSSRSQYSSSGVQGPSWSWISVNSPVEYRLWHPYVRYTDRRGEEILERATTLKLSARRENQLGFDRFSGQLTIEGPFMSGHLYQPNDDAIPEVYFPRRFIYESLHTSHNDYLLEKDLKEKLRQIKSSYTGHNTDKYHIEEALLDHNISTKRESNGHLQKIHCLLLLQGGYSDMLTAQYCLILKEDKSHRGCYRRLGLCVLNTRHICVDSKRTCTGEHADYSDCMGTMKKVRIV